MRIGFFTDSYLPRIDGVATTVASCAKELEKMGHEVYIIAPRFPGYKDKKNVIRLFSIRVDDKPETRMAFQVPQRSLLKLLRMDFDIIHGHSGGAITFLGWQIAQVRDIPYIATYHTLWNRYSHYFLRGVIRPRMMEVTSALFGNVCDCLIAPTDKVRDELRSYGIRKPVYTIPSGLQIERFGKSKKGYLRELANVPRKAKILLTVSRIGKEKSIDFLLQVFKEVYKEDPLLYFVVVGDGPEEALLKELAKNLGISDRVIFAGPVPHQQIQKVYVDADVFVYASSTETQGMVILEAMASYIPVVAVQDKVFKNVIENGFNGFAVRKDKKLFAQKILAVLHNEKTKKEMARNARKTAEKYSVKYTAEALDKLYRELLLKNVAGKTTWKEVISSLNSDVSQFIKSENSRGRRVTLNIKELNRIKQYIKQYLIG